MQLIFYFPIAESYLSQIFRQQRAFYTSDDVFDKFHLLFFPAGNQTALLKSLTIIEMN